MKLTRKFTSRKGNTHLLYSYEEKTEGKGEARIVRNARGSLGVCAKQFQLPCRNWNRTLVASRRRSKLALGMSCLSGSLSLSPPLSVFLVVVEKWGCWCARLTFQLFTLIRFTFKSAVARLPLWINKFKPFS